MLDSFREVPPIILGVIMAVVIALIRVVYEQEETSVIRVMLEGLLCGALAVVAGTGIEAMGLDQNWVLFSGGMVGFIGSQSIRAYANTLIKNKVDKK